MIVKVISLNLWYGGKLFEDILTFLRREDADILLLQEVYSETNHRLPKNYRSIEILNQELNYMSYDFAPAMLDKLPEGKVESGNAVFSKFPITSSHATFFNEPYRVREALDPKEFPTTPRNLQHVTLDLGSKELNVFNFQGVWDLDGDNFSPQRQHMSDVIIAAVKNRSM